MSNIGNKLLSGYFKTPIKQGEYLSQLINVKGTEHAWFDPTCGTGEILQFLKSKLGEDKEIATYGVELECAHKGI